MKKFRNFPGNGPNWKFLEELAMISPACQLTGPRLYAWEVQSIINRRHGVKDKKEEFVEKCRCATKVKSPLLIH